MNPYIFHISLYDLVFLGAIFIGLIFTLLLWFTKRINQAARLHRLLAGFSLFWLLWIPLKVADYFYYHYQLVIYACYPLYFFLAAVIIWIGMEALSKPKAIHNEKPVTRPPVLIPSTELMQKGIWVQKAMEAGRFYQDAELNLRSLAETLNVHPNGLSRIINVALGKNFNDFINEYRIREVIEQAGEQYYLRPKQTAQTADLLQALELKPLPDTILKDQVIKYL